MKLPRAANRCCGSGGGAQREHVIFISTFLTKNSCNKRRNRVERRIIADPKWFSRFLGKTVGAFPMQLQNMA